MLRAAAAIRRVGVAFASSSTTAAAAAPAAAAVRPRGRPRVKKGEDSIGSIDHQPQVVTPAPLAPTASAASPDAAAISVQATGRRQSGESLQASSYVAPRGPPPSNRPNNVATWRTLQAAVSREDSMEALMATGDVASHIVSTLREDGEDWESSSEGIMAVGLLASWGERTGAPLVAAGAARECVLAVNRALYAHAKFAPDAAGRCAQGRRCAAVLLPTLVRLAQADPAGVTAQFTEAPVARALAYIFRAVTSLPVGGPSPGSLAAKAAAAAASASETAADDALTAAAASGTEAKSEAAGAVDGEGGDDSPASDWAGVSMLKLDIDARLLADILARAVPNKTDADAADASSVTAAAADGSSGESKKSEAPFVWNFPGAKYVPPHLDALVDALLLNGAGRTLTAILFSLRPGSPDTWRATQGVFDAAIAVTRSRPEMVAAFTSAGVGERLLTVLQGLRMVVKAPRLSFGSGSGAMLELKPADTFADGEAGKGEGASAGEDGADASAQGVQGVRLMSPPRMRKARLWVRSDPPAPLLMSMSNLMVELTEASTQMQSQTSAQKPQGTDRAGEHSAGADASAYSAGPASGAPASVQLKALLRAAKAHGPLHAPWLPFRIANVFSQPLHGFVATALLRLLVLLASHGDSATRYNALLVARTTTAPVSAGVTSNFYIPLPDSMRPRSPRQRKGLSAAAPSDLDPESEGVMLWCTNEDDKNTVARVKATRLRLAKARLSAEEKAKADGVAIADGVGAGAGEEAALSAGDVSVAAKPTSERLPFLFARKGPLSGLIGGAPFLLSKLHSMWARDPKFDSAKRRRASAQAASAASPVLAADKSVRALDAFGDLQSLDTDANISAPSSGTETTSGLEGSAAAAGPEGTPSPAAGSESGSSAAPLA